MDESSTSCSDEPVAMDDTPEEDSMQFVLPFQEVKINVNFMSVRERWVLSSLSGCVVAQDDTSGYTSQRLQLIIFFIIDYSVITFLPIIILSIKHKEIEFSVIDDNRDQNILTNLEAETKEFGHILLKKNEIIEWISWWVFVSM